MRFGSFIVLLALVSACTDRSLTPTVPEALNIGSNYTVFAATSRQPEENGNYGFRRSKDLSLLELTVSIPPEHKPGTLNFGYANPNPRKEFTMAGRKQFDSPAQFQSRLNSVLSASPGGQREVTVFVHGFNATQAETAFRAAQIANDINLPGALMVYSWPSKGKALAYAYDGDSALFARDGLETVIRNIQRIGTHRIVLVAHSMGSLVVMEALRQIEIKNPGWSARHLGGVILISPDLDVEVFRSQIAQFATVPSPFIVFVSEKDKALNVSSRLRGTYNPQRLGNLSSIEQIADLPIEVVNTTAFAKSAGSTHFIPATSPALIAMLNSAQSMNSTFGPEELSVEYLLTGVNVRDTTASEIVLRAPGESPR